MFPSVIKMNIPCALFFILLSYVNGQDRRITSVLNPGFDSSDNKTLVYVKAVGTHDTIHQLWDFTRGIPTVIYVVGSTNSTMNVTWEDRNPVQFRFSEKPDYSFAIAIDKIYEYDDQRDVGHIEPADPQRHLSLRHLSWRRKNYMLTATEALLDMHGAYKDGWRSATVNVKLELIPYKDYGRELPHLIHTANSTLLDISLVNITTSKEFNASRFALHTELISTDKYADTWNYSMRKSLDDEHTPGVFEIIEIRSPRAWRNDSGGFLQFRPVAYTDPERDVSSSTNAHVSDFNRTSLPRDSTLKQFYNTFDHEYLLVQDIFVSFGLGGDGYYKQHNYTSWSFSLGYGQPPTESFSLFVIIIISIGLGVPVLLALSGIGYVVSRRCKQRNPPTRLENEE